MSDRVHARFPESLPVRIAKITLKALGLILVFGTIVFFLWRAFISTIVPSEIAGLSPNTTLSEVYTDAQAAGKSLTLYTPTMPKEALNTMVVDKNYGYFTAADTVFIEEADQVQVLLRYNNSTIKHLMKDYGLTERPDRTGNLYDVTLYVVYDKTPEDDTDNGKMGDTNVTTERIRATSVSSAESIMYNYRRLTFDGVDMNNPAKPVLAVYVDIYYVGDVDYDKDAYGTLCIYDYKAQREPYELSKKEIVSLIQ